MKKYVPFMALVLLIGLLMTTGCERKYTGSEDSTVGDKTDESEAETEPESVTETNPATVKESIESEKVTETKALEWKDYESSLGYHVLYDEELFECNRSRDYDEIALKGQTFSSKPSVFFAAMKLKNDDVESVINEIFTDSVQETVIGSEDYRALCQPTVETEEDGKRLVHHNQYLVRLDNGDALLFEIQWYEEDGDSEDGKKLSAMLDSIVIDETVPESDE